MKKSTVNERHGSGQQSILDVAGDVWLPMRQDDVAGDMAVGLKNIGCCGWDSNWSQNNVWLQLLPLEVRDLLVNISTQLYFNTSACEI